MKQRTVGQALFNSKIPKKYRDYNRDYTDKDAMQELWVRMAKEMPSEEYRDVSRDLFKLGGDVSYFEGLSFSSEDLQLSPRTKQARTQLYNEVQQILSKPGTTREERNNAVIDHVSKNVKRLNKLMMSEESNNQSGLALQATSGSRGKESDLQSLLLGDMLMTDDKGNLIPIPLLHGYAEGVDPAEYFSNSFGTRMGVLSTKMATADSGFLAKRLKQVAHRQVVTEDDCGTQGSIEVESDDTDSIGAILAAPAGGYEVGTPLTASMLKKIKTDTIQVRSPNTCQSREGVCAHCAGVRETGEFPNIGDNLGIIAGQSRGEKATQKALSNKHSAGRTDGTGGGNFVTGFNLIEQLMSVPKSFRDSAVTVTADGLVESINDAPQGGKTVRIEGIDYHVPAKMTVTAKIGDEVEAGDLISDGIPNPSELVKYKGIGETRRIFTKQLREATGAHRRNTELLSKAFVDYVKITDPELLPNSAPDDIVKYSQMIKSWKPRKGYLAKAPVHSVGRYLETPVAQYTVGTRISKKVGADLKRKGITTIDTHDAPPPFEPVMVPSVRALTHADDWQERMGGYHLKDSLLEAASQGMTSDVSSTSFIPAVLKGTGFGDNLRTTGKY